MIGISSSHSNVTPVSRRLRNREVWCVGEKTQNPAVEKKGVVDDYDDDDDDKGLFREQTKVKYHNWRTPNSVRRYAAGIGRVSPKETCFKLNSMLPARCVRDPVSLWPIGILT